MGTDAVRATPSGMQAFTCVTPAYTRPAKVAAHRGASMPPILTVHGAAGAGYGGTGGQAAIGNRRRGNAVAGDKKGHHRTRGGWHEIVIAGKNPARARVDDERRGRACWDR